MDDRDLGRRFASGGEAELEELIRQYGASLLRYATTVLCDHQEAENVVQDVFLAAYQSRAKFDGLNVSAWLYKITYNRSINQIKRRKVFPFGEIRAEAAAPPEESAVSEQTLQALQRLKPQERALIYGRVIEEQSYEELARLLGRSPAALRKQYERAKKKLAGYLSGQPLGQAAEYGKGQQHECI